MRTPGLGWDSGDEALFIDEGEGGREEGGLVEEVVSVAFVPGEGFNLQGGTDEDSNQVQEPKGRGKWLPRNLLAGEATVSHMRQNQAGARVRPQLWEEEGKLEWQLYKPIPTTLGTNIPSYTSPL